MSICIWIITCHETIAWLYDYQHCSLWVWLCLWFCWLDKVSHSNTYIGSSVTFWHTYWIRCHVLTHALDRVSRFDTLTVWVWVPWENYCDCYAYVYLSLIMEGCMFLWNDNWTVFCICVLTMGVAPWSYQYTVVVYWYYTCSFFVEYRASSGGYWQTSFRRSLIETEFKGEPVLPGCHEFSFCLVHFLRT